MPLSRHAGIKASRLACDFERIDGETFGPEEPIVTVQVPAYAGSMPKAYDELLAPIHFTEHAAVIALAGLASLPTER